MAIEADEVWDAGEMGCGELLLERGGLLEFRSTEISVEADFPAWCRMTGNELVSWTKHGKLRSFLVCKGALADRRGRQPLKRPPAVLGLEIVVARGGRAIDILGVERVLLTPDCGFATFADNPVASSRIAEAKLRAITDAAERLRNG